MMRDDFHKLSNKKSPLGPNGGQGGYRRAWRIPGLPDARGQGKAPKDVVNTTVFERYHRAVCLWDYIIRYARGIIVFHCQFTPKISPYYSMNAARSICRPCLYETPSVLAAGLVNANPIIHPSITLLNLGRMEQQQQQPEDAMFFYGDGASPMVCRMIQARGDF
jgi:hypothetical protein